MNRLAVAGLALVSLTAACGGGEGGDVTSANQDATLSALRADFGKQYLDAPDTGLADEASYRALATAIGDGGTVSFGGFTPEADGAVATDVSVRFGEDAVVGFDIASLRIYDLASDALASLNGEGDSVDFASRVDAEGITWVGLAEYSNDKNEMMLDAMGEAMADAIDGDVLAEAQSEITSYEMTTGRAVVEGLTLHPVSFDGESVGEQLAPMYQLLSADLMAFYDTAGRVEMVQMGETSEMAIAMPMFAYEGYDQGNLALAYGFDAKVSGVMAMPMEPAVDPETGEMAEAVSVDMPIAYGIDAFAIRGMELKTLIGYLASGEAPSMDVTDLMSLGVWEVEGLTYDIGEQPFYSLGKATFDLSSFQWFLPTEITVKTEDERVDLGGMLAWAQEMQTASGAEDEADLSAMAAALEDAGLSTFVSDADFSMTWSPDSGEMALSSVTRTEGFLDSNLSFAANLSDYEALKAAAEADQDGEGAQALQAELMQNAALRSFRLSVDDQGGVEGLFAAAVAVAKTMPEDPENPMLGMIAASDPASLRQMAGGMIAMGSAQFAAQIPAVGQYATALSTFITSGGSLTVEMSPEEPVGMAELQAAQAQGIPAVLDTLGLTVTQTGAEGAE